MSTLQRIISRITKVFFPIFAKKFIPSQFVPCRLEFENYPEAVAAVDSTTIPFYNPGNYDEKKKSWDGKNHINGIKLQLAVNPAGIAIHINCEYIAGTHDKKIFDLSHISEFLTIKRGKRDMQLPILADRGYTGIQSYHVTAIVQKQGTDSEIIKENGDIAHDRVIVENYIGRLKQYWGVCSEGFRGERANLQLIIPALVGLTNYLIDQNPLRKVIITPEKSDTSIGKKKNERKNMRLCWHYKSRTNMSFKYCNTITIFEQKYCECNKQSQNFPYKRII